MSTQWACSPRSAVPQRVRYAFHSRQPLQQPCVGPVEVYKQRVGLCVHTRTAKGLTTRVYKGSVQHLRDKLVSWFSPFRLGPRLCTCWGSALCPFGSRCLRFGFGCRSRCGSRRFKVVILIAIAHEIVSVMFSIHNTIRDCQSRMPPKPSASRENPARVMAYVAFVQSEKASALLSRRWHPCWTHLVIHIDKEIVDLLLS